MNVVQPVSLWNGAPGSAQATYGAIAASILGPNSWQFFDDFVYKNTTTGGPQGWQADQAGATFAMLNAASTETGGVEFSTIAALAANRANLFIQDQLFSIGNKGFYCAVKQRATVALGGANQVFGMAIADTGLGTSAFGMGFNNSRNATNFIVGLGGAWQSNASTSAVDTGKAVDLLYHVWEVWSPQGSADLSVRFDGGAVLTAAGAVAAWGATKTAGLLTALTAGATATVMGRETSWVLAAGNY